MATPEQIESLEIFVECATEIELSTFLAQAKQGISTSMRQLGDRAILMERIGPDHEAVKALLLTLRFLCQNNETSIEKTDALVQALAVPDSLKREFAEARTRLNQTLDAQPPVKFQPSVGADTNRNIFETYLYGSFAHANRAKRRTLKSWEEKPWSIDLRAEFDRILVMFIRTVVDMKTVCIKVLAELNRAP